MYSRSVHLDMKTSPNTIDSLSAMDKTLFPSLQSTNNPLSAFFNPVGDILGLPHLANHIHLLLSFLFLYHVLYNHISPLISHFLFPKIYPRLSHRDKVDWDGHIVSLVQSCINSYISVYILLFDSQRNTMGWQDRVWGYSEGCNVALGVANGYFVWHAVMMCKYKDLYGWSMVAHGFACLAIMLPGWKPAFNYYAASGISFELSNIFMNIHRFTIKLGYDNSLFQLLNAWILTIVFVLSRLIFGQYTALKLFTDLWNAITKDTGEVVLRVLCPDGTGTCTQQGPFHMSIWIILIHLSTNLTFIGLNWYWFWGVIRLLKRRIRSWRGVKVENGMGIDYYPSLRDFFGKKEIGKDL
ncbi:hypothetical protein EAF04_004963 [Stromatinia cepivora]|nr:hypothetical protein EAF04_004963 [Stromatinia cepivora]